MTAPAFVLPEVATAPRELASLGQRLGAALIDGVLWFIVAMVGMRIARPHLVVAGPTLFRAEHQLAMVAFTLPLLIYQWRSIARSGQSIGKRWLKIEIVCVAGPSEPGWLHGVVLREWLIHALWMAVYIVGGPSSVPNWLSLAIYVPIFFPQRRCMHDYIAGTQVVRIASDGKQVG